nr:MAG TPA: hypothetical protein [Caudoviricetes sp.]
MDYLKQLLLQYPTLVKILIRYRSRLHIQIEKQVKYITLVKLCQMVSVTIYS